MLSKNNIKESNIIFTKEKNKQFFNITMCIENDSINMSILDNFNIYKILGSLNDKILEKILFEEETEHHAKILFLFKDINKD